MEKAASDTQWQSPTQESRRKQRPPAATPCTMLSPLARVEEILLLLSVAATLVSSTLNLKLLPLVAVREGDAWCVHHAKNDETYPVFNPRRNWEKGFVVKVQKGRGSVKFKPR